MLDGLADFGVACLSDSLGFDAITVRLVVFVRLILGPSLESDATSSSLDGASRLRVVSSAIEVNGFELEFALAISGLARVFDTGLDVGTGETGREGVSVSRLFKAVRRDVDLESNTRSDELIFGSSRFVDVVIGVFGDGNTRRPLVCGSALGASD